MYINELFVHDRDIMMPYLLCLLNNIFNIGHFPEAWSESFVVPLHKKGNIHDVDYYGGITLIST